MPDVPDLRVQSGLFFAKADAVRKDAYPTVQDAVTAALAQPAAAPAKA